MSLDKEIASAAVEYSIEELFIMYKTPIYQFVYRYCQDEQLSIDIVQDTFVRFHKYEARFDASKSNLKTYLFRMAYQLMINRLKRRSRMKQLLPFLYPQHQQQLESDIKLGIKAAIEQLPDDQRAVILLTYYEDLPQKEIARILEIPIGTVKSRLYTSLNKLKGLLEDDE
ncbi:RNA polymerase sigma factor [Radiobacillus sp. PE A8.2]|uniref:RNA polymerase sigma factor n=1 Tax=Radiobacillus sp. PE A8.2 TaxID=3380349 RepID=UPI00388EAF31